jgi:hypothetical protein
MAEWIPPGGALNKRPGLPNRLSREPGRRFRLPGERTKDSKPRRATGSGRCLVAWGYRASLRNSGPEAEQDEKNSYTGAKRQGLDPCIPLISRLVRLSGRVSYRIRETTEEGYRGTDNSQRNRGMRSSLFLWQFSVPL